MPETVIGELPLADEFCDHPESEQEFVEQIEADPDLLDDEDFDVYRCGICGKLYEVFYE